MFRRLSEADRHFALTAADLALLNPNTRTCPTFRWKRDSELTKAIYGRMPVLVREGDPNGNPWGVSFMRMFDMANDSHLFHPEPGPGRLPLYEGKMIHLFDHRFGTYEGQTEAQANKGVLPQATDEQHADPAYVNEPRYWVDQLEVQARLAGRWDRGWLLGWRDITNSVTYRTVITSAIPRVAVGHNMPLAFTDHPEKTAALLANLSAFVFDYIARQKVGGTHLTFFLLEQLPVLTPDDYRATASWGGTRLLDWLAARVVEPRLCVLGHGAVRTRPRLRRSPVSLGSQASCLAPCRASTRRSSISTASGATTSTTSWTRSGSSATAT